MLTGDRAFSRVHAQLFGDPVVSNVLSQRIANDDEARALGGKAVVGELCINVRQARREAADAGIEPLLRVLELGVHGLLHLAGYDHHDDGGRMYRRQDRLMRKHGPAMAGG